MKKRTGLIGENSNEYVHKLLKVWNSKRSAALIDYRIPFKKAVEMLMDIGADECYIEDKFYDEEVAKLYKEIRFIPYSKMYSDVIELEEGTQKLFCDNYSKEEALVLFSSGTTGKSKGILLSHEAINKNADMINSYMHANEKDCIYIVKTLAHSSTIVGELLVGLKNRCGIVMSSPTINPRESLRRMNEMQATILCLNPSLLNLYTLTLSKSHMNLDTVKNIFVSGSIMESDFISRAREVFKDIKIKNVYGLSEAGPRVTAQIDDDSNSVGKPLPGVEVKILNDSFEEVSAMEKGTIYVKTPSICDGYANREITLYDGWLNTKDIGYLDEKGNLFISGRADNMITVGSHNVYVEEIEERIIASNIVNDCLVLKAYSKKYGNRMICYYVADTEREKELNEFCNHNFANYEKPYRFAKVEKIKTTYSGKKIRNISEYEKNWGEEQEKNYEKKDKNNFLGY